MSRPLRILIADDEPTILFTLTRLLERRGHSVSTAATASEARALITTSGPLFDVALIDRRMPGGGLELALELRDQHGLGGRVLLMSGGSGELREFEGMVFRKPFDFGEVIGRIEALGGR